MSRIRMHRSSPGLLAARTLTISDLPIGSECLVPRAHDNGECFYTWCAVTGHRDGKLLVDVPEPGGMVTTPISLAFLLKHSGNSGRVVRYTSDEPKSTAHGTAESAPDDVAPATAPALSRELATVEHANRDVQAAAAAAESETPPASCQPTLLEELSAGGSSSAAADSAATAWEALGKQVAPAMPCNRRPARVPTVRLKLTYPPGVYPSARCAKKFRLEPAASVSKPAALWPGGSSWMPSTTNWGTRSPGAFGCGKCRWSVVGCRGCIAAAAEYARCTPPHLHFHLA